MVKNLEPVYKHRFTRKLTCETESTLFSTLSFYIFLMDLQFSSFSVLFSFFIFVFAVSKLRNVRKTDGLLTPKPPPGPWKLPIIGNMHRIIGSLPHHRPRDLANIHGPIMHVQLGEVSTIVLSTPEATKEVMKTNDTLFAHRPYLFAPNIISYGSAGIAFAPYGDYRRQMQKICALELLNSKRRHLFDQLEKRRYKI